MYYQGIVRNAHRQDSFKWDINMYKVDSGKYKKNISKVFLLKKSRNNAEHICKQRQFLQQFSNKKRDKYK